MTWNIFMTGCIKIVYCFPAPSVGPRSSLIEAFLSFAISVCLGSKSQNCLWNTIIGGLTGNLKEKSKPTIVYDQRPPEEILADELPPVESSEALVKTSFRFDRYRCACLFCL